MRGPSWWWHRRSRRARAQRPLLAGESVSRPDGPEVVLPRDWQDLTVEDMVALGVVSGDQPDFYLPQDRVPAPGRATRRSLRALSRRPPP